LHRGRGNLGKHELRKKVSWGMTFETRMSTNHQAPRRSVVGKFPMKRTPEEEGNELPVEAWGAAIHSE